MPPSVLPVLALGTYAPGTYVLGPVTVPIGIAQARLAVDLTLMTTLTAEAHWHYELSRDSGVTWMDLGRGGLELAKSGFTVNGLNQYVASDGTIMTEAGMLIGGLDPLSTTQQVRGTLTVTESVQTKVTVTLS